MVMTAGGPADSSQVLGTWMYRNAFLVDNMGYAAAIATLIFVLTSSSRSSSPAPEPPEGVQWW